MERTKKVQSKVNRNKAMLVGAAAIVAAELVSRVLGLQANPDNSISAWGIMLPGGALVGLGVAAFINRKRT